MADGTQVRAPASRRMCSASIRSHASRLLTVMFGSAVTGGTAHGTAAAAGGGSPAVHGISTTRRFTRIRFTSPTTMSTTTITIIRMTAPHRVQTDIPGTTARTHLATTRTFRTAARSGNRYLLVPRRVIRTALLSRVLRPVTTMVRTIRTVLHRDTPKAPVEIHRRRQTVANRRPNNAALRIKPGAAFFFMQALELPRCASGAIVPNA